mmetsp:Transcript_57708/g.162751  ORF Transcript_57708/g.162751 Transcript_57708/m.162751 type:complete len:268 (+) Transcript_57708:158-961(+)
MPLPPAIRQDRGRMKTAASALAGQGMTEGFAVLPQIRHDLLLLLLYRLHCLRYPLLAAAEVGVPLGHGVLDVRDHRLHHPRQEPPGVLPHPQLELPQEGGEWPSHRPDRTPERHEGHVDHDPRQDLMAHRGIPIGGAHLALEHEVLDKEVECLVEPLHHIIREIVAGWERCLHHVLEVERLHVHVRVIHNLLQALHRPLGGGGGVGVAVRELGGAGGAPASRRPATELHALLARVLPPCVAELRALLVSVLPPRVANPSGTTAHGQD